MVRNVLIVLEKRRRGNGGRLWGIMVEVDENDGDVVVNERGRCGDELLDD